MRPARRSRRPTDRDVDPNAPDHPVVTAANWYGEHYLDLGYLRNPPHLRLWRTVRGDRDEITVDWRHEDDGEIGFTAGPAVRFSVPTAAYLEAVHTLDRELMTAMRQRVEELQRRGGLPGVELDLADCGGNTRTAPIGLPGTSTAPEDRLGRRPPRRPQLLGDAREHDAHTKSCARRRSCRLLWRRDVRARTRDSDSISINGWNWGRPWNCCTTPESCLKKRWNSCPSTVAVARSRRTRPSASPSLGQLPRRTGPRRPGHAQRRGDHGAGYRRISPRQPRRNYSATYAWLVRFRNFSAPVGGFQVTEPGPPARHVAGVRGHRADRQTGHAAHRGEPAPTWVVSPSWSRRARPASPHSVSSAAPVPRIRRPPQGRT